METRKRINNFSIVPEFSYLVKRLECSENDPVYHEIKRLWIEWKGRFLEKISPEVLQVSGNCGEQKSEKNDTFLLFHLGEVFSRFFGELEDSYFLKILIEFLAEECLLQMKEQLLPRLEEELDSQGMVLLEELEYPRDLTEEDRKDVYQKVRKVFPDIEENMEKYSVLVLVTAEGEALQVKERQVTVEVLYLDQAYEIAVREGKSLLEEMRDFGLPVSSRCAGKGECGMCSVRLDYGKLKITSLDYETFSQEELEAGYRLSCQAYPIEFCTVILP